VNQSVASPVHDGNLLCALGGAHNIKGSGCFRGSGSGDAGAVEPLWWDREAVPEDASPVLYEGKLYAVTIQGVMSCYDPATGALLWRTRLPTRQHHSSLVAGDGKVYAYSSWGRTVVVNARADQFELLADNGLEGRGGNASPALANGCVVIRTLDELFKICGEPSSPVEPVTGRGDDQEASLTGDSPSAPTAR
jgi:outer membrane protein assembly factor BamB